MSSPYIPLLLLSSGSFTSVYFFFAEASFEIRVIKVPPSSSSSYSPKAARRTASICSYREFTYLSSSSLAENLWRRIVYSFSSLLTDIFSSLFFLFCSKADFLKNSLSSSSTSNFYFQLLISFRSLSFILSCEIASCLRVYIYCSNLMILASFIGISLFLSYIFWMIPCSSCSFFFT